ncbi:rhomboid family intramembrane serine protease [Prosthecobacter sp.]|uniref:rhomboid family intramembrane serine protease n=1 Tax=Prosthecobacter sp. TaxID=1965333 RepID=UPI002ABCC94B|nr:rhomboid family intramembrane serine protease [Prosthecobacter sp.]MDZ4402593.1 rhomboid family intramembrane serine protease [Prosthecobacter sp.]
MALSDRDYMREAPHRPLTRMLRDLTAFQIVLGINIAVFVMQYVFETGVLRHPLHGETIPLGGVSIDELARGHLWTLLTYMFVHGSLGHLLLNMLMLYFAGRGVQQLFGSRHFTLIYLFAGIVGAAAEMAVNGYVRGDTITPLVGASASVFGLLMALAVVMPEEEITAFIYFIIPVRMRLWTLAKALFLIQLAFGLAGVLFSFLPEGLQIAYFAHLGGAALGWFYARSLGYGGRPMTYASQWQPPQSQRMRKPQMARTRVRPLLDLENEPTSPPPVRPANPVESLIEEEVNPILDKIGLHGIGSLTDDERRTLERASRELDRHRQKTGG